MSYDWLIVGAGFSGCVMARQLADAGKRVLIIDKRDHIGGNAYDYVNEHGVRIHKYGPHIFHTNCDAVFEYLSRFTEWRPYEHRVLASVRGKLVPFPINLETLGALFGDLVFNKPQGEAIIADSVAKSWPKGKEVVTAEDQCLATVGRELYELFFAGYTRKMWGVDASELDKSVTARIPIRFNRDDRYFTDKHQAMPKDGYTAMFERMLDHPNITVHFNMNVNGLRGRGASPEIWTGPIDEFFGHCYGPLPYRSLRFEHFSVRRAQGTTLEIRQPAAVLNFPGSEPMTRRTEWWQITGQDTGEISIRTNEYPTAEGDPYYPIPAPANRALYQRYRDLADKQENVIFLGRLGTYAYMNMDQVVGQALACARRILA